MSSNKQNSIEWLDNELASLHFDYLTGRIDNKDFNERHEAIIEQAKAMHKEEIETTYEEGMFHHIYGMTPKEYYDETYNTKEK